MEKEQEQQERRRLPMGNYELGGTQYVPLIGRNTLPLSSPYQILSGSSFATRAGMYVCGHNTRWWTKPETQT